MTQLPQTRHSLIIRLQSADSSVAWAEFYDIYESAIYRYARHKGLQHSDAEDITQDVLAAVHGRIQTWEVDPQKGTFRAWLFRVIRNLAAKAWNERQQTPQGSGDTRVATLLENLSDPDEEDKSVFALEYRRSKFHWAAEQVREEVQEPTWQAFWFTAVQGVDSKCVAQRLGMSIAGVYTAKCRVLSRIRTKVQHFDRNEDVEQG